MKPKSEQPDSDGNTLHMRLPALAEQQKIGTKLDSLFAYIDDLQKTGKLNKVVQDQFKSYVLDKVFSNQLPDTFYSELDSVIFEHFIKELESNNAVDPLKH